MGTRASRASLTWMGFSMSPSHRDTSGTVNGFHTGSSVYLITYRTVRDEDELGPGTALLWGSGLGNREWQDGEPHNHTSRDASGHLCGGEGPLGAVMGVPVHRMAAGAQPHPKPSEMAGLQTHWPRDPRAPTHPPQSCGPASTCHHLLAYRIREMDLTSQRGPRGSRRRWVRERKLCRIQRGEGHGLAASPSPVAGAGAGGGASLIPLSSASARLSKTTAAPWDQLPPPGETTPS